MSLNKADAIKKIESLEGDNLELEVFTKVEHTTFLENYEKDQIEKKIGVKISEVHNRYDEDLFEITGKKKNPTEKTYDANKRILGEYKTEAEKIPGLTEEITELKKGKVKDPDEQLTKENADLLSKYNTLKESTDNEIATMKSGHKTVRIKGILEQSMVGMKFKDSVPEAVRQSHIESKLSKLIEIADLLEDDTIVFRDKDEIIIKNENNGMRPFTAKEMVLNEMKDIIDTGKTIKTKGDKPTIVELEDGKKDIVIVLPDSVSTKGDLAKHLATLGLERNSLEYKEAWKKYSPKLKAR